MQDSISRAATINIACVDAPISKNSLFPQGCAAGANSKRLWWGGGPRRHLCARMETL